MSDANQDAGAPAWVMTFADLMSLLMCFFVLLLSFSEMDVLKYKQIAGSMQNAFGVQRDIKVKEIPKGTSIIAKEFSPGKPDPTPVKDLRQKTVKDKRKHLEAPDKKGKKLSKEKKKSDAKVQDNFALVTKMLQEEIQKGQVKVNLEDKNIVISIEEKGSFDSGSADVQNSFMPVMDKIRNVLMEIPGQVAVSGHSDDLPILTDRFRSNWELSSARAASTISALLDDHEDELDTSRFVVHGFADTKPVADNNNDSNRAKNRRVEITIMQGGPAEEKDTMIEKDVIPDATE